MDYKSDPRPDVQLARDSHGSRSRLEPRLVKNSMARVHSIPMFDTDRHRRALVDEAGKIGQSALRLADNIVNFHV